MQPDPRALAAVFAGGFAGAIARVALADSVDPTAWPWATFVANVAGALLLGYVAARLPAGSHRLRFWGTGLCGALTTFSTLQLELLRMLDGADYALAAGYVVGSVGAGVAAVIVGSSAGRRAEAAR